LRINRLSFGQSRPPRPGGREKVRTIIVFFDRGATVPQGV